MRFRVTPFRHPEYSALLERSQPLALLWGMGHVFMVVFLAIALVAPLGVVMVAMIDPEFTKERAWDLAGSCMATALLVSAMGFAVRLYAKKRGKSLPG
jgi:hypothetical protein